MMGGGADFGTRTHEFAEQYALGGNVEPTNDDERHIKRFVDSLDGELRIEEDVYLPLAVDEERVTISGIADLVSVRPKTVEVVDFKTDLGRHAEDEYRKQLSVYYHVLSEWFPDRDVSVSIFYTADGERIDIDPFTQPTVVDLTRGVMENQRRGEQRAVPVDRSESG